MTTEQYIELKNDYIDHIKRFVNETGGLFPHFTVFADVRFPDIETENKPALIHVPIPDKYINTEKGKDEFVEEVIPELFKGIKKEFIPRGIAWASEAWMRTIDKTADMFDYKKLPKKEVIIVNIESKDDNESFVYELNRLGKQVNSDGDLVDHVELKEISNDKNPTLEGRFTGLFKLF